MNDSVWYYVDRAQQRLGPVTAAAVAEAWRAGQADDASLVWREGMSEWKPLAEFREELGLSGVAAAAAVSAPTPVAAPASYAAPPPPAKSGKGCLIAALVVGLLFLVVIGILAAIALPAYRDYVERAEAVAEEAARQSPSGETAATGPGDPGLVAAAVAEAHQHEGLVNDFVANTDRCPRDSTEVDVPPVASAGVVAITVGEARTGMCTIEIELGGPGLESLSGQRITLSRDSAGDWYCTSDIEDRDVLPEDCR